MTFPWKALKAAFDALAPSALKLLEGDERAVIIAAKKLAAKAAIKELAASKIGRLGK